MNETKIKLQKGMKVEVEMTDDNLVIKTYSGNEKLIEELNKIKATGRIEAMNIDFNTTENYQNLNGTLHIESIIPKPKFKVGDFVFGDRCAFLLVRGEQFYDMELYSYLKGINNSGLDEYRLATPDQITKWYQDIAKLGYKLNDDLTFNKIEKKRCRAKENGFYYIISDELSINKFIEENNSIDDHYYNCNNYFKTEYEAQKYADKFKEMLK